MNLFTTFFVSSSKERQAEINLCLKNNIESDYFERIHIFLDEKTTFEDFWAQKITEKSEKINFIKQDRVPSYKDWIVNSNFEGVSVFCNADIYFDESIKKVNEYLTSDRSLICLSRYEVDEFNFVSPYEKPDWSQDCWAITGRDIGKIDFLDDLDIPTGRPRCDNKLAYIFCIRGWDIYNPIHEIKSYHLHNSKVRTYDPSDSSIIGGLGFVHPCLSADEPSKIEIVTMPLKTSNIVHGRLRVDGFLSDINPLNLNVVKYNESQVIRKQSNNETAFIFNFENAFEIKQIEIVASHISERVKISLWFVEHNTKSWTQDEVSYSYKDLIVRGNVARLLIKKKLLCTKIKINAHNLEDCRFNFYEKPHPRFDVLNQYDPKESQNYKDNLYTRFLNYDFIAQFKIPKKKYKKEIRCKNILDEELREGVGGLVCIKNRESHLLENIRSWLLPQLSELIIIDWSSDKPVHEELLKIGDKRIKYVYVKNEKKYIRSYAQNLGARLCKYDKILKIDADINIRDSKFLERHKLSEGEFYVGEGLCARDDNEKYLHGTTYLHTSDYFKINGYNETLRDYGWDDSDFTIRLLLSGLRKRLFDLDSLYHLPHNDLVRASSGSGLHPHLSTLANRLCCMNSPLWNNDFQLQEFNFIINEPNYILCERTSSDRYSFDGNLYAEALSEAIVRVFTWLKIDNTEHESWISTRDYEKMSQYLNGLMSV